MTLLAELKRRRVFRVGAAYLVIAWLAVQAASIGLPAFEAPAWVLRVFILAALVGFPVAVVMAWAFEWTPDGVRVEAGGVGTKRVLGGALVLVGLAVAWYFLGQPAYRPGAGPAGGPVEAAAPRKSIAVLPFTDLSPGHDQEYFSDGVAEEILNALVRVKDLKVAGRTSSFSFKGRNEDLRTIGRSLGVAHVLEGSVRKQGQRVRITAQLVQSEDGFHLWSETYDGDLSDVFELQDRIARAVSGELQLILLGDQRRRLVPASTASPEAYALFLQATAIFNRRDGARWGDATSLLEQAVRLDPGFARAHARLAAVQGLAPGYMPERSAAALAAAEEHAKRAIALDATLAEPHAVLGLALGLQRRFAEGREAFRRALALEPDDVTANFWLGTTLVNQGYRRQGNQALDRVLAIDPFLPNALLWRGIELVYAGDLDAGERLLKRAADLGLAHVGLGLSASADARGRRDEAIAQLEAGVRVLQGGLPPAFAGLVARGAFGDAGARAGALAMIDAYLATKPAVMAGVAPYALVRLGEPARALVLVGERPSGNDALVFGMLWGPYGRAARALPEFSGFVRRSGLAEVWERYGPPDGCRREGDGEWSCADEGRAGGAP